MNPDSIEGIKSESESESQNGKSKNIRKNIRGIKLKRKGKIEGNKKNER